MIRPAPIGVAGLHHVTAIAGPAQENLEFYAGVMGLRLVKKSVNQDDPGTYHLFYADAAGHPGTDLTFFPWAHMAPTRQGHGLSTEVALTVPPQSLTFWTRRLAAARVSTGPVEERFGARTLPFVDPHGMRVALVERVDAPDRQFTPWPESPVPVEHQIRGLDGARMLERDLGVTSAFLIEALDLRDVGLDAGWRRFSASADPAASGGYVDVQQAPAGTPRGFWGVGSIHHLAWRVADDAHQFEVSARVAVAGTHPTSVIDRFWFKSVYFKEPGGVLFELATDGPGFAVDEDPAHLGESLVLPPWLEPQRAAIAAQLPVLDYAGALEKLVD